jgi:4-amino-4-deoxy-L-arabinose transferase-like glycosyltransferase
VSSSTSSGNASRQILIATIAGLALRLAWWWYAQPEPVSDFEYYRRAGVALLDHHQFGFPRPSGRAPGYPAFLAVTMLFGRSLAWLSIANILLSTALVPMTARLTRLLTGWPRAAIVAAWVVALNPTFVFFAPVLASEHLFAALLVTALIAVLSAARGDRVLLHVAGAGALMGAAALARADAMFYVPLFAALAWWRTGRRALAPAALLLSVAVVLAPWYIRNRVVVGAGAGISTAGGLTFYYAHNDRTYGYHPLRGTPLEGLDEAAMQTRGYQLGLEYLSRADWSRIIRDIGTATRLQFVPSYPFSLVWATQAMGQTPDNLTQRPLPGFHALFRAAELLYYALLCGAALSLIGVRRYPRTALCVLWGVIGLNWFAHCVIFLGEGRYRYPAELMCCMLVALLVPRRV